MLPSHTRDLLSLSWNRAQSILLVQVWSLWDVQSLGTHQDIIILMGLCLSIFSFHLSFYSFPFLEPATCHLWCSVSPLLDINYFITCSKVISDRVRDIKQRKTNYILTIQNYNYFISMKSKKNSNSIFKENYILYNKTH